MVPFSHLYIEMWHVQEYSLLQLPANNRPCDNRQMAVVTMDSCSLMRSRSKGLRAAGKPACQSKPALHPSSVQLVTAWRTAIEHQWRLPGSLGRSSIRPASHLLLCLCHHTCGFLILGFIKRSPHTQASLSDLLPILASIMLTAHSWGSHRLPYILWLCIFGTESLSCYHDAIFWHADLLHTCP